MTISGFTFVRNATLLDYPLKASIQSILPLVSEFVIAYCTGDKNDRTLDEIQSIKSDKIKIINETWVPEKFTKNTLYAYLSDKAKAHCRGDWLFYLQCDEVVHEQYLPIVKEACHYFLHKPEIEGLLFNYKHFWGDYDHCFTHHGWYPREIRIIRNIPEIHSWQDAQSFRKIENFEPSKDTYLRKNNTQKLKVAALPVYIFHYGWVRPPDTMTNKRNRMSKTYDPDRPNLPEIAFDYGPLQRLPIFKGTHPGVMKAYIERMDWKGMLQYHGTRHKTRAIHRHEMLIYRIRSWIEINLLGGREIGGFRNYKVIVNFHSKS